MGYYVVQCYIVVYGLLNDMVGGVDSLLLINIVAVWWMAATLVLEYYE